MIFKRTWFIYHEFLHSKCSIHQFYTYSQGYIHKDIFTRIYLQGYTATSVNFCKISLVPLIICKLLFCHPFCLCDLFLKKEMDWSAWRILDNINVSDFLSGICLISSDACLRSHPTPPPALVSWQFFVGTRDCIRFRADMFEGTASRGCLIRKHSVLL